jgi:hypothetical protein
MILLSQLDTSNKKGVWQKIYMLYQTPSLGKMQTKNPLTRSLCPHDTEKPVVTRVLREYFHD